MRDLLAATGVIPLQAPVVFVPPGARSWMQLCGVWIDGFAGGIVVEEDEQQAGGPSDSEYQRQRDDDEVLAILAFAFTRIVH